MSIEKDLIEERGLTKKNKILRDLTLGKRSDLETLTSNEEGKVSPLAYLCIFFQPSKRKAEVPIREVDLKALDSQALSAWQKESYQSSGYLDAKGDATSQLLDAIERQTPAFEKALNYKHARLFKFIDEKGPDWKEVIAKEQGLVALRHAVGVQKGGWFSIRGVLTDKAKGFLREQSERDFEFLSSRLTSQYVSLLNLLATYGDSLNESLYKNVSRSNVSWEKQAKAISWMKEKGLIDEKMSPTLLSTQIRLNKISHIKENELFEKDCRIEEFLRLGRQPNDLERLHLSAIPAHELESRIFRMRASGFVTDSYIPTPEFSKSIEKIRASYAKNIDPPWLIEKRSPSLSEISEQQRNTLLTLATETPYLSETQILRHFSIDPRELKQLSKGQLLKARIEIIGDQRVRCLALNNEKTNALLKEAGIEKPLRGKFQRGSHMRHDFMLFESLQEFKKSQLMKGDPVVQILHERAIYQMKTSANDNKGVTTSDLVVRTAAGQEVALEYGNYTPPKMVHKVINFPQTNVVVYTSDTKLLSQYIDLYKQTSVSISIPKTVTWDFIPEVFL